MVAFGATVTGAGVGAVEGRLGTAIGAVFVDSKVGVNEFESGEGPGGRDYWRVAVCTRHGLL